jgi:hypothetical protein
MGSTAADADILYVCKPPDDSLAAWQPGCGEQLSSWIMTIMGLAVVAFRPGKNQSLNSSKMGCQEESITFPHTQII